MNKKRNAAQQNVHDPEILPYKPSRLDDLGLRNASLLSQMRAGETVADSCMHT